MVGQKNKIEYLFYKKLVSTNLVTPYRSAQPLNGKVASLAQDAVRILSNCDRGANHAEVMECLEKFATRLQRSGYPVDLVGRIVRSGIISYERRLRNEISGKKRIHRHESEGKSERLSAKVSGKSSWFRRRKSEVEDGAETDIQQSVEMQKSTFQKI